ncbi:Rubrerythrin [Magnetococcus marinus MC-1]|uniref:Rubrerythrin n=1 Tax=Magnetococcus marinus (strain ATCC BAA-1437 / JCM 17883 / MC-1) TaxID=156889 RepID=A0LCS9_MAGMM|nr:rubrerythrin family protein [Magnetococcus marinus]ABK45772.1 Rubrerythrin [Magnetococcus marinus MC-1]
MSTTENLQAAFAGESQANRKYLAFAKKAEQDGFSQVAKLFQAVAEAETIHAHSHLRVLDGVHDTAANLEAAMAGEDYEFTTMYPEFIAAAEAEGNSKAVKSFKHAMAVEKIHHQLFIQALEAVKAGQDLAEATFHICPVCGHTEMGPAPESCPVCGVKGEKFLALA